MSKEKSLQSSPQLGFVEHQGAAVVLSHKQIVSLYKKSTQSGIPFEILQEVYHRGYVTDLSEQDAFNRVNSFISGGAAVYMDEDLNENNGLWANIRAKRERIKHGSGERMRKPGSKGAPTTLDLKNAKEEHEYQIDEAAEAGLAAKAKKSGISISTLRKVYNRGMAAWNSGHRPGTTPQQWAMARVNSYITKGKGTYGGADKDLHEIEESAVKHDPKTGLPMGYRAGLSDKTAAARKAHFDRTSKMSDSDPRAYEPAPGDATAKTKESKHTKKYHKMYGEEYTGAEKVSKNKNDASSRFIGTSSLVDVYKKDTPGYSVLNTIKKVVKERYEAGCPIDEEIHELIEEEFQSSGQELYEDWGEPLEEATKNGRRVSLGKPFMTPAGPKKRAVYVKNGSGNVVKVNFGDPNMRIKKNSPSHRKSFRARHHCDTNPGPRWKARYWSCRQW
jgi:hypothetical protein